MTTLKTPSPQQWRKLCEMAEGFSVEEHDHGVTVTMQHPSGESSFPLWALPNDTDALMRLLDELVDNWVLCTFTRWITKPPSITLEVWRNDWFSIVDRPISGDRNEMRRLAACDILAQLAEAEGWE